MKNATKVQLTISQLQKLLKEANEEPKVQITFSGATVSLKEVAEKLYEVASSYKQKGVTSVGDLLTKSAQGIDTALGLMNSE